jgi:putative aminopeptidase FrvX
LRHSTASPSTWGSRWTIRTPAPRIRESSTSERGRGSGKGPNTNPVVLRLLQRAADEERIPYQLKAEGTSSPTDARMLQTSRGGPATGLLSMPLRYMHTPSEVLCLKDIQHTIDLVCAYILRLEPDIDFTPW